MLSTVSALIKKSSVKERPELPETLSEDGDDYYEVESLIAEEAKAEGVAPWKYLKGLYDYLDVWAVREDGYDTDQVFVADHNLTDDEQLKQCIDFSKEKGYNIYQMSEAGRCGESFWLKVAELAGEKVLHVSHLGVKDSYSYEVYSYQEVEEIEESYEDSYDE